MRKREAGLKGDLLKFGEFSSCWDMLIGDSRKNGRSSRQERDRIICVRSASKPEEMVKN